MRSPAWLDNWPAGLTIEIKYLPCPLEPPAAVAFPRLRQPSPFPGLFNGYVVRRVVRPACCIIRGLTRIPAHIPARSVLKRLSLAITTVANTRNLLQGFILTSLQGARDIHTAFFTAMRQFSHGVSNRAFSFLRSDSQLLVGPTVRTYTTNVPTL